MILSVCHCRLERLLLLIRVSCLVQLVSSMYVIDGGLWLIEYGMWSTKWWLWNKLLINLVKKGSVLKSEFWKWYFSRSIHVLDLGLDLGSNLDLMSIPWASPIWDWDCVHADWSPTWFALRWFVHRREHRQRFRWPTWHIPHNRSHAHSLWAFVRLDQSRKYSLIWTNKYFGLNLCLDRHKFETNHLPV